MGFEDADQVLQRMPGIDYVFDDQHMSVLDIAADVHDEAYGA